VSSNPLLNFESNKLFYNKYLYKFVFNNSLATIFRDKNFNYAKEVLDDLHHKAEKGEPLVRLSGYRHFNITQTEFHECVSLYHELRNTSVDYKLRIENPCVHLYSNDKAWILNLATKTEAALEFWEPAPDVIKHLQPNVILVKKHTGYDYKVTLGDFKVDAGFSNWINNNLDKIKIGSIAREHINNNGYCANFYFYVRDERVLNLIKLIIAPSIRRIDKLVCKQDIDK